MSRKRKALVSRRRLKLTTSCRKTDDWGAGGRRLRRSRFFRNDGTVNARLISGQKRLKIEGSTLTRDVFY